MGLFDDLLDAVVTLPGAVVEVAAEAIVRVPEVGIKVVQGVVNGVESGIDKVSKALD